MPPASEDPFEPAPPERFSAVQPATPVQPGGTVADRYRIDRTIGFGGMGVICEATHLELGTKVAIKFVRLERAGDDRAVARFLTEARSAALLKSLHTCRVVDCGRLGSGSPYMVMEYLEGADLRSILAAQAPLPVEESVCFAAQACEALAEAHARNIVHRDIKPENLFLTQGADGGALVKVLDFGISKQVGLTQASRSLTEPSESIGSPYHMSPEQMIDPTQVDARTDIWSIGVILYEFLTGKLPFTGESTPQVCANVMTSQPKPPNELRPEIPEALSKVVMTCMEKDRDKRFADVGALSRALEAFGGARSGLSATRVERILDRAKEARSARAAASDPAGGAIEEQGLDVAPEEIPGLPSRARSLRVVPIAVLGFGLAGVLLYYVVTRAQDSVMTVGIPASASVSDAPSPSAPPSTEASASVRPTPEHAVSPDKSAKAAPHKPKPGAHANPDEPNAGTPNVTDKEVPSSDKSFPPADKSNLYPVLKPVPDLPSE